jgi:hypothetical protein
MVTLLFLVQSFGVQIPVGLPSLKTLLFRSAGLFYVPIPRPVLIQSLIPSTASGPCDNIR